MLKRYASCTSLCLVVAFASLTVVGCSDDDSDQLTNPGAGAPVLPSLSTMTMDLSFFGIANMAAAARAPHLQ